MQPHLPRLAHSNIRHLGEQQESKPSLRQHSMARFTTDPITHALGACIVAILSNVQKRIYVPRQQTHPKRHAPARTLEYHPPAHLLTRVRALGTIRSVDVFSTPTTSDRGRVTCQSCRQLKFLKKCSLKKSPTPKTTCQRNGRSRALKMGRQLSPSG